MPCNTGQPGVYWDFGYVLPMGYILNIMTTTYQARHTRMWPQIVPNRGEDVVFDTVNDKPTVGITAVGAGTIKLTPRCSSTPVTVYAVAGQFIWVDAMQVSTAGTTASGLVFWRW